MECQYRSKNGRFLFKIEGAGHKDLFESIASLQEVFESDETCGLCNGPNLRFIVRTPESNGKEYTYFELRCQDCGARFEFGQARDMKSLFPKRNRDPQGNETEDRNLPTRGWYKYSPQSAPDDPGEEAESSERYGDAGINRPAQPIRAARDAATAKSRAAAPVPAKCPECRASGKYHSPTCSRAGVTGASAG